MSGYPNKIVLKIGRGAYLLRLSLQFAGSEYSRKLCCVNSNFLSIPAADFPRVLSTFSMYVTVHMFTVTSVSLQYCYLHRGGRGPSEPSGQGRCGRGTGGPWASSGKLRRVKESGEAYGWWTNRDYSMSDAYKSKWQNKPVKLKEKISRVVVTEGMILLLTEDHVLYWCGTFYGEPATTSFPVK